MVAVPSFLKGKTILDAHQWVTSQIDGRTEYTLSGPTGQSATLSDLTTGKMSEVVITPQGARANPAPSYAFKPSAQPQKRIQQFSSRVLLPDGLSPSLVHALEAKHGSAYRFIASKMLAQRSRRGHLSPKGHRMLSSMVMADSVPGVLSNPIGLRQTPSGLRLSRVIGDRGRVMDDKILEEVKAYLTEDDIPHNIGASEEQFEMFRVHVLQPYLVTIKANMELIRYLNETLIPHMNRLIDNGEYTATAFEAQGITSKVKAKTGAGKAQLKKALARRYETIVTRLATSPKDFYSGRNEALIAHPAFMYPQARFLLLPPPLKLTGGSRAELFLYQAGEPPRYGQTPGGAMVQHLPSQIARAAPKDRNGNVVFPIARVNNQPNMFGSTINADSIATALRSGDIGGLITMASQAFYNTEALRRMVGLGAATPPGGLSSGEQTALAELNSVVDTLNKQADALQIFRENMGMNPETIGLAAAIEVNIGGMRPRPIRWPEGFVMCMMQVLGENVEQIVTVGRLDLADPNAKFFTPKTGGVTIEDDKITIDGSTTGEISILELISKSLTRYKEQGGQPTPSESVFVLQLLAYCLANLDADVNIETGVMDALAEAIGLAQTAANEGREEAFINLISKLDDSRGSIPSEDELRLAVFDRMLEDLFDEILSGGEVADYLSAGVFGEVDFDDEGDPVLANPRRNPPIDNIASITGSSKGLDSIRKARDTLRNQRRRLNIDSKFSPDEATVRAFSERLRGVFREALRATQAEREEAQRIMERNELIEQRLGNATQIENRRKELTAFQRTIRHIDSELTSLINSEEEYVRGWLAIPNDPFMELENNITREQMLNHPLYIAQMLHGQHEMFMRNISNVENQARSALRIVQGEIARMGAGLSGTEDQMAFGIKANESRLDFYLQAIEFCNGLQEAYGEVGGYLNTAIEEMRVDEPDNLSVNLYLALFDVADNFSIRSGVRAGLRASAETVSSPVDPLRNERVFNDITEKSFDIIANLFGAFPGDVPTHPPNQVLGLGTTYLTSLINANIGFGGDREDEMRRDEIIRNTVAGEGWAGEAMRRQAERYYRQREQEERLAAIEERDKFTTRNMAKAASMFEQFDIDEAVKRRRERAGRLFERAGQMGMTSEAYEKTQRRLQRDQDAEAEQAAYNKAMGNEMFKIALRTPSSEVRNVLMQEKMRLEQQIGSPYVEAVTPEDQAYNFHVLANGIALQSMLELGEISQAMFDRAKRQKLPVDSVRNMLKGLAQGRASQAEERYKKALLKAVQDVVAVQKPTFETRENLTNDAYVEYMMNVSREDYEMKRRGVATPALGRLTGESDIGYDVDSPFLRDSDYGPGMLSNPPSFEMDVLNKRGKKVRTVGAEEAAALMREYGFQRRGMDLVPTGYDATQEILNEARRLASMVDTYQSQYDSKPFQRGMGQIPAYGASQTTPMADGRARDASRGPAISWSEGAAAPAPSARRPVSKPMGRGAFAPRLNGKVVNWLE